MKNLAVIFAGGIGKRMNSRALPKQLLKLYGKEIIIYTIEHFEHHEEIDGIVISCVEDWIPFMEDLISKYRITKVKEIVPGGKTGQESIFNGLVAAEKIADGQKTIALIHDGVRPLINKELITECISLVKSKGNAVTVAPANETIIRASRKTVVDEIIKRDDCLLARAPQCFYLDEILNAHRQARREGKDNFIDSASMMSYYGNLIYLAEGPVENIKITTPMDYYTFKALVEAQEGSQLFGV